MHSSTNTGSICLQKLNKNHHLSYFNVKYLNNKLLDISSVLISVAFFHKVW